jgi:hypothetical protein
LSVRIDLLAGRSVLTFSFSRLQRRGYAAVAPQRDAAINGDGLAGNVIVAFEKKTLLSIVALHSSASRIRPT